MTRYDDEQLIITAKFSPPRDRFVIRPIESGERKNKNQQRPKIDSIVDCYCWCEREIVKIPISWVSMGKTKSCWRKTCLEL